MSDTLIITNGDSAMGVMREGELEGEILHGVNWWLFFGENGTMRVIHGSQK